MLLHLLHLLLDGGIQLVLKLEGLHVVHVAVAVEEVALQSSPGLLLGIPCLFCFILIVAVTGIPGEGGESPSVLNTRPACCTSFCNT